MPIMSLKSVDFLNMQVFIRNVLGITLMVGLFFVVGCASTQSASGTSAMASGFPWSKAEKEQEKASHGSMDDILGRSRTTSMVTR